MARDGVFFRAVGWLDPRSRVPVVAIVLQGVWAALIALTGTYDRILNYVVALDVLFFGLTGASLLVFRARRSAEPRSGGSMETTRESTTYVRVPGHPVTTVVFVLACWALSVSTVVHDPGSAGIGVLILLIGVVVYQIWRKRQQAA